MGLLVNAILMKILSIQPAWLFRSWLILCAMTSVICPLIVSWTLSLLERTKKAKARIRRELNAELQAKYDVMCRRAIEAEGKRDELARENVRLVGLLKEETSHSIDFAGRARTEIRAAGGK